MDETLKIKIPVIGKGPFTVKLKKDDADASDMSDKYRLNEIDGTVTFTILSKI